MLAAGRNRSLSVNRFYGRLRVGLGSDEYKLAAAEFYHAYAAHLCGMGEVDRAKVYVGEAAKTFPAIRLQMLEDPGLAAIFGGVDYR